MNSIEAAIIHRLSKDKHGRSTVHERSATLALSEPVKALITDIHDLYAEKAAKGYGRFEPDEETYPSAAILRTMAGDGKGGFIAGSRKLMKVLASRADQAALATGGYVLMALLHNEAGARWFIVAIINNVHGNAIDEETLEVIDSVHVDLENLRVAGRVNLTDWLGGDPDTRYVGFLKQRGEVAEYFKIFLGCNELIKNTDESKRLSGSTGVSRACWLAFGCP